MNGTGFVFLEILKQLLSVVTILALFFAAICHLAIYTDRSLRETHAVDTARMLIFAGNTLIGVRWAFLFSTNGWDLRVPPIIELGILLISIAQIITAADRLIHGNRKVYNDEPTTPSE